MTRQDPVISFSSSLQTTATIMHPRSTESIHFISWPSPEFNDKCVTNALQDSRNVMHSVALVSMFYVIKNNDGQLLTVEAGNVLDDVLDMQNICRKYTACAGPFRANWRPTQVLQLTNIPHNHNRATASSLPHCCCVAAASLLCRCCIAAT